eukprot:TRINITY_DN2261_c0_g2_i1.p1 TRINITY_DN2261_c0_g2~~TRINITY_DN2261_c0_g2_i1.p1  ORF type:complete len:636 (+),score=66.20 TRINITY_DN2261_c0_g2_i1:903-2810(+)
MPVHPLLPIPFLLLIVTPCILSQPPPSSPSFPVFTYYPAGFCPALNCSGPYAPSPFFFLAFSACNCSAYFSVTLLLPLTPFVNFTATEDGLLRSTLGTALGIFPAQIWVQSANRTNLGEYLANVQFFPLDLQAWPLTSLSLIVASFERNTSILGASFGQETVVVATTSCITTPCTTPPTPTTPPFLSGPTSSKGSSFPNWVWALISLLVVSTFLLLVILVWRIARNRGVNMGRLQTIFSPRSRIATPRLERTITKTKSKFGMKVQEYFVREYTLEEIIEATDDFSDTRLLGVGGYGMVYHGHSLEGVNWAVKRSKKKADIAGVEEFQNEVDVISKMSHRNLVRLLGYCEESNEQILVYEFVPNGTLRQHLRSEGGAPKMGSLTFTERLEVAIGAAEGLRYLHSFAKPPIIHRDVKSDNILMDMDGQAKVADFGVLKHMRVEDNLTLVDGEGAEVHTRVVGTPGYLDPEYYQTYKVTDKSDVYSFGVVLLELITGQPSIFVDPLANDGETKITLARWAIPKITKGDMDAIVDPYLQSDYPEEALQMLGSIAAMCVRRTGAARPDMAEVATRLNEIKYFLQPTMKLASGRDLMNSPNALMKIQEEYPDMDRGMASFEMGTSTLDQDAAPVSGALSDR